jgi:hypothetical protein
MTEYPIPAGPVDVEPRGTRSTEVKKAALQSALTAAGVELGAHDERVVSWLTEWEWSTVATIASWINRAAAESKD